MRFVKILVSIGSVTLMAACSPNPNLINTVSENDVQTQGILGGTLKTDFAVSTNFVNIVSTLDDSMATMCTGVVLSKRAILTGAYCVPESSVAVYVLRDSKLSLENSDLLRAQIKRGLRPVKVTLNPAYLKGFNAANENSLLRANGLAVLHFASDFPANFTPAQLPYSEVSLAVGDDVTVAGFGVDRNAAAYGFVQVLNESFGPSKVLLSQSKINGACFGDGGGPAFVTRQGSSVLLAVAGYQNVPAGSTIDAHDAKNCKGGGVYFRIDTKENLAWIKSEISKK